MDAAIRLEQGVDGQCVLRRSQRVVVVERRSHGQPPLQARCPLSQGQARAVKSVDVGEILSLAYWRKLAQLAAGCDRR